MLKSLENFIVRRRREAWAAWLADPTPIDSPREVRLHRRLKFWDFVARVAGV